MQLESAYNRLKSKGRKDPTINNISYGTFMQMKKDWTSRVAGKEGAGSRDPNEAVGSRGTGPTLERTTLGTTV